MRRAGTSEVENKSRETNEDFVRLCLLNGYAFSDHFQFMYLNSDFDRVKAISNNILFVYFHVGKC